MTTCPKCNTAADKDDQFCRSCGASLKAETKTPTERAEHAGKEEYTHERDICFGERERHGDYTGLISFGIFLLIIGIIFLTNSSIFSEFDSWIKQMSETQMLSRPPQEIINSAVLFFALVGLSNFFVSAIRFITYKTKRRALSDACSGVALVTFSYLVYLYGQRALAWQMVLAVEVLIVGLLIMAYSIARYLWVK